MKKIILIILIIISLFIIYKFNEKKLIDYINIGDSISIGKNSYGNKTYGYNDYLKEYLKNNELLHKYNNYFSKDNYKIEDLTNDIINNKTILYNDKSLNLKKELRESDIVTISIGMDELVSILNTNNNIQESINNLINKMDKLIKNMCLYAKNKIILIGYYNPYNNYNKEIERNLAYINDEYNKIARKYNIYFIDIYNSIKKDKNFLPNKNDYHLTSRGYLTISNKIIEEIEKW